MDTLNNAENNAETAKGAAKPASAAHKSLITRNLKIAYNEVASQPLPSAWLELLNRLEDGEDKKS